MPFYLIHANTSLQKVTPAGDITTLTLPSGVTMVDTRPARFATLAGTVVVVNAVSKNVAINAATLAARLLTIDGPSAAPTVAAATSSGSFFGSYRFAYTYAITSGDTVLSESPFSPIAGPLVLQNRQVAMSAVTVSGTSGVNARIIYMTTNNGETYFEVERIEDNTTTSVTFDGSDYDLGLLAEASSHAENPPGHDTTDRFRIITAWKDRLFASPDDDPDDVWFSGNREVSSWGDVFTVPPAGEDQYGVTAFMARRDELVLAKRRRLWKLVGDTPEDYEQVSIDPAVGAMVQEGCIVIEDVCYFLGENGFYEYGPAGVRNLSRENVHPWFTSDDFFNRAKFANAFCKYNALYDTIELHLAAAGSTDIDRWVTYHRGSQQWFGPHKTGAFTPTAGATMDDTNGFNRPVIGSSAGFIYAENYSTASDDGTAIEFDAIPKWHSGNTPDIQKLFGQAAILCAIESGGTLSLVPKVGGLDASAQTTISLALTSGQHRTRHLGTGRLLQMRFYNNENNRAVMLYGYEVPFHELSRRSVAP
jgi:hypothetical protein